MTICMTTARQKSEATRQNSTELFLHNDFCSLIPVSSNDSNLYLSQESWWPGSPCGLEIEPGGNLQFELMDCSQAACRLEPSRPQE